MQQASSAVLAQSTECMMHTIGRKPDMHGGQPGCKQWCACPDMHGETRKYRKQEKFMKENLKKLAKYYKPYLGTFILDMIIAIMSYEL